MKAVQRLVRFTAFALTIGTTPICFACELCRDAVVSKSNGGTETASLNFNGSILIMLGTLFIVAGFIGRVMFQAIQSTETLPKSLGPSR